MGAIILKQNFYIKKRKLEAARSMYKVDLMSLTNDMWMSSLELCAGQGRIS